MGAGFDPATDRMLAAMQQAAFAGGVELKLIRQVFSSGVE
jgi:hypothetical protein